MQRILVVIDMQVDFVSGSLGSKEALGIIEQVTEKIQSYPKEQVYATRDTHGPDYLSTMEGQKLPIIHCQKDTKGWEIYQSLADLVLQQHIFDKQTFGSVRLAQYMQELAGKEPIELELVGLCTDICVVSNALLLKAYLPNTKIIVDASCCAGSTPEKHQAALDTMRSCQIDIIG
ncbi:Nicotinamidase-related amidase [Granulicatella balaenopterae]|uniref:Nicotinamidase-related amidase n=1 Tax=Granulicatella balaenopterae TaxID=137733 RepID=A0A1H9KWZ7_9LACT|nr:isochorismatase family cysteine hydrolase [Granulicatella balaenopterae]SER03588.1 Nicotinamidase-related amidase [Granulicatella balaenopterae]